MKALVAVCALSLVVLAGLAGYDRWEVYHARVQVEQAIAVRDAARAAAQKEWDMTGEDAASKSLEDQFRLPPPKAAGARKP
jgi:hypothetical protein